MHAVGVLVVGIAARLSLAVVFGTSAYGKLRRPRRFSVLLRDYGVPDPVVKWLGAAIAGSEVGLAAVWLTGNESGLAATATSILLLGFSGGILRALRRGLRGSCGCDGVVGSGRLGFHVLMRNAALIILAWTTLGAGESVLEAFSGPKGDLALSLALCFVLLVSLHIVGAIGSLAVLTTEVRGVTTEGTI